MLLTILALSPVQEMEDMHFRNKYTEGEREREREDKRELVSTDRTDRTRKTNKTSEHVCMQNLRLDEKFEKMNLKIELTLAERCIATKSFRPFIWSKKSFQKTIRKTLKNTKNLEFRIGSKPKMIKSNGLVGHILSSWADLIHPKLCAPVSTQKNHNTKKHVHWTLFRSSFELRHFKSIQNNSKPVKQNKRENPLPKFVDRKMSNFASPVLVKIAAEQPSNKSTVHRDLKLKSCPKFSSLRHFLSDLSSGELALSSLSFSLWPLLRNLPSFPLFFGQTQSYFPDNKQKHFLKNEFQPNNRFSNHFVNIAFVSILFIVSRRHEEKRLFYAGWTEWIVRV